MDDTIIDNSPVAFYSCKLTGEITYFNQSAVKEWGRKPVLNKDVWCGAYKIFHPDGTPLPRKDHPVVKAINNRIFDQKTEVLIQREDGSFHNLLLMPQPWYDTNTNLIGAHCYLVNGGSYGKNHVKQSILSAIVESSDDAIVSKDLNGVIMSWNRGAEQVFGYTEAEAVGRSITMLIPEERLEEETIILKKLRKGEKIDHFETIRKHKSGKEIAISLTVSPIKDHNGNIIGASKVARDITPQAEAQKALKKYSENLEVLHQIGKSVTQILDVETILKRITYVTTNLTNSKLGGLYYQYKSSNGQSSNYFTGSSVEQENIPKLKSLFTSGQGIFTQKKVLRFNTIKTKEGSPEFSFVKQLDQHFNLGSLMLVPIISKSGTVTGNLLLGHGETDHYSSDDELLMMNIARIASISLENSALFEQVKSLSEKKDEFIALASHELKTPLTTVMGYLQLLSKLESDSHTKMFVEKSLIQAEKLNNLIEDILNMSRIEKGKLHFNIDSFDIKNLLKDITQTFSHLSDNHKIETILCDNPVIIEGDPQRIEQVILNLLTNACKYSPEADKVEVKLEDLPTKVIIKVKDYGIGLTKDQQNKLFTRFYRAEGVEGISGLGLGLYLTKLIIERHKGEIGLTSEYGKGSEFYFSLPKNLKESSKILKEEVKIS